ncbi:ATP-binding protein [Flavilitoribacter nigricans]|uniref:histidine kinase n=1 Tax=Flavilitoribacter nigricans (strain ATCC 23147 / DSM 23189 / NBRC 102662 / NCIMB 1420 / SS-2) TaxID=1122177 RepID=A0A2D0N3D2_FLAN2|nr:ATP-binding protein [Flavilitoribacter nigricans]PHN03014.1 histidine kinase [Flavilitoribacter nigricans DSM 23189 = NBRC 102662]
MSIETKPANLVAQLRELDTFKDLPAEALEWLIDKSDYHIYKKGSYIFEPDQTVDHMQIILEGEYTIEIDRNGTRREMGVWGKGNIAGVLPFSRMTHSRAYGMPLEDTHVLELHRDYFVEMVNVSYDMVQALVAVMSTRIRDFSQIRYQDEKLLALGKLSAGLAHELNNPASAMVRSSEELYRGVHATPDKFKNVITMRITPEQTDRVNEILFSKLGNVQGVELSLMEKEEVRDDLMDWLEDHEVNDADQIAETYLDFGITVDDLDDICDIIEGKSVGPIMAWIESTLNLERLVAEIQEAAGRISGLIKAIKSYSHMDRASTMENLNVHEGIISTLIILKHKIKNKNIQLVKEFMPDLPQVCAIAGNLNQVWTNLIDNAIDAMEPGGTLTIRTAVERSHVCVYITDTGSGISEEDQSRIFDPFFSTKPMGEGTGMGLDIVKKIMDRHMGEIKIVESRPGKTTFRVCFALS